MRTKSLVGSVSVLPLRLTVLPVVTALAFFGCSGEGPTAPSSPTSAAASLSAVTAGDQSGVQLQQQGLYGGQGKHQVSDMNDRFATEQLGANGFARVVLAQTGGIEIDRVKIQHLEPNHDYVLKVTAALAPAFGPLVFTSVPITASGNGSWVIDDADLGFFAPGTYRIDVFVTHDHVTVPGTNGNIDAALNRDPLQACQPAFFVVVS